MAALRLSSFADLAQFQDRWNAEESSTPPLSSPPGVLPTPERAPRAALRTRTRDTSPCRGLVAFVTGPHAGFVTDFGASVLMTRRERAFAFVFPDRAALDRALALALGMNRRSYNVEILPVGSNS